MSERQPFRVFVRSTTLFTTLLLVSCISSHSSPVSPSADPDVVFRIYKPLEESGEILDVDFLLARDQFPKLVELDQYPLMIRSFVIQKRISSGFTVSMEVEFQGEISSLGFWHGRDPTADYYSAVNGCLLNVAIFCKQECGEIDICGGYDCRNPELYTNGGISSNDCGGILMIEVDRWVEIPSKEEREAGIEEILLIRRIYLDELDYDYVTDEWNFMKVVLGLHREEIFPPILEQDSGSS